MAKKKKTGVDHLDLYANLFEFRDWDYTANKNIKSIRYNPEYDYTNKLSHRIKKALWWLFAPRPDWLKQLDSDKKLFSTLNGRIRMFFHVLQRDPNTPDGTLDNGNIITYWGEMGEYLSLMQPTVGSLLVNFLKEEPEHPHAIIITKEIERLYKRLEKRRKAGEIYND